MPNYSAPEAMMEFIEEAVDTIKDKKGGTIFTLVRLNRELEPFARNAQHQGLATFYFVFRIYRLMVEGALEEFIETKVTERLRRPIRVADRNNPGKTTEKELSLELAGVAFRYRYLTDFFATNSETFNYQMAKEKLVPNYVDEDILPAFVGVLVESYESAIETIRDRVSTALEIVTKTLRASPDIQDAINVLWEHFFLLHREARQWPELNEK